MPQPHVRRGPSNMRDGVTAAALVLHGEERFQPLRRALGGGAFGINLLRVRPGPRGRNPRHERQGEVCVVLEGSLALGGAEPHEGCDGEVSEAWEETDGRPPQQPLPAEAEA